MYWHIEARGQNKLLNAAESEEILFHGIGRSVCSQQKEFTIVALAPFVSITAMLLILFFVLNPSWQPTVVGTLLLHTAMCSGDFGLLCYLEIHRDKEIVTYDDVPKMTYFFGRPVKSLTQIPRIST